MTNNIKNKNKNNNTVKIFEIIDYPKQGKNFHLGKQKTIKNAAHEAFELISNSIEQDIIQEENFLVFSIIETNMKKEYKFIGTKIKLENPVYKTVNGKEHIFEYKNIIGEYKKSLDDINRNV